MSHSRYPRHSSNERDSRYEYLEDMDFHDDELDEDNKWFPWIAGGGLCAACVGIGIAFSWLMSPVPTARDRNLSTAQPTEVARADLGSNNRDSELETNDPSASVEPGGRGSSPGDDNPLGVPLTDLPLIPVDPATSSRVRPSHITADLDRPSANDSELLTRDGEIAIGPARQPNTEFWSERESSRNMDDYPRDFFPSDRRDADGPVASRRLDDDRLDRELDDERELEGDRERVESSNVAVATTTSPRLDLGPSLGEGSYLVLMAYQGDNSLSQARSYSQGAFIKQLDGETYVQLAAFDQLEYARHMADDLRKQGVAVLILQ